jgi:hypothetical protein
MEIRIVLVASTPPSYLPPGCWSCVLRNIVSLNISENALPAKHHSLSQPALRMFKNIQDPRIVRSYESHITYHLPGKRSKFEGVSTEFILLSTIVKSKKFFQSNYLKFETSCIERKRGKM